MFFRRLVFFFALGGNGKSEEPNHGDDGSAGDDGTTATFRFLRDAIEGGFAVGESSGDAGLVGRGIDRGFGRIDDGSDFGDAVLVVFIGRGDVAFDFGFRGSLGIREGFRFFLGGVFRVGLEGVKPGFGVGDGGSSAGVIRGGIDRGLAFGHDGRDFGFLRVAVIRGVDVTFEFGLRGSLGFREGLGGFFGGEFGVGLDQVDRGLAFGNGGSDGIRIRGFVNLGFRGVDDREAVSVPSRVSWASVGMAASVATACSVIVATPVSVVASSMAVLYWA